MNIKMIPSVQKYTFKHIVGDNTIWGDLEEAQPRNELKLFMFPTEMLDVDRSDNLNPTMTGIFIPTLTMSIGGTIEEAKVKARRIVELVSQL